MKCALLLAGLLLGAPRWAGAFDDINMYESRQVRGFTVLLHPAVLAHKEDTAEMLRELAGQFDRIEKALPVAVVDKLRQVRFWVEWEVKPRGAMECHWSAGWLKDNGYNPAKVCDIEINNVRHFIAWSRQDQPWMVMHELAHAYHRRVLGENHAGIRAAFDHAVREKLYESVPYCHGGNKKAYAATNTHEYFAELTEAYLGRNDFFPFNRAELEKHDPVGHTLMQEIWNAAPVHKP